MQHSTQTLPNDYQDKLSMISSQADDSQADNKQTIISWLNALKQAGFNKDTTTLLSAINVRTAKKQFIKNHFNKLNSTIVNSDHQEALFIAVQQLKALVDEYEVIKDNSNQKAGIDNPQTRINHLYNKINSFTEELKNNSSITEKDYPVKHFYNKDKNNSAYTNVSPIGFYVYIGNELCFVSCAEALFQAMRALSLAAQQINETEQNKSLNLAKTLLNNEKAPGKWLQAEGGKARTLPAPYNNIDTLTYDQKLNLMYEIIEMKFTQHPALLKDLLDSQNEEIPLEILENTQIAEYSDAVWGNGWHGMGANTLGEIYMKLRQEYLTKNQTQIPIKVGFSKKLCEALDLLQSTHEYLEKQTVDLTNVIAQHKTEVYNAAEKPGNQFKVIAPPDGNHANSNERSANNVDKIKLLAKQYDQKKFNDSTAKLLENLKTKNKKNNSSIIDQSATLAVKPDCLQITMSQSKAIEFMTQTLSLTENEAKKQLDGIKNTENNTTHIQVSKIGCKNFFNAIDQDTGRLLYALQQQAQLAPATENQNNTGPGMPTPGVSTSPQSSTADMHTTLGASSSSPPAPLPLSPASSTMPLAAMQTGSQPQQRLAALTQQQRSNQQLSSPSPNISLRA